MPAADWDDVRFDYDGSLDVARRLWQLADTLEGLAGERRRWAIEALVEWEGRFATEYAGRLDVELGDVGRHATDLRGAALGWAQAWASAINQQNRRLHARAVWRAEQDRSVLDSVGGFFFGHDDIPPDPRPRAVPSAPQFSPTGGFAQY
jgi:hypothetical protein